MRFQTETPKPSTDRLVRFRYHIVTRARKSATSRLACDVARSLVSKTENGFGRKRRSNRGSPVDVSRARTPVPRATSRVETAHVFSRLRLTFSRPRRRSLPAFRTPHTSLPAVSDPHTQLNEQHVHRRHPHRARRAQAGRRAPRARPRARVRRRRAGETLRRHRTRCEVRAPLDAPPTRERGTTNATRANPPAGTHDFHRFRPTPPAAPRAPSSRRRAARVSGARVRPTVRVFPRRATTDRDRDARRKRRARGPTPPRALMSVSAAGVGTRSSAGTRRDRGGPLAHARRLLPLPSRRHARSRTTRR